MKSIPYTLRYKNIPLDITKLRSVLVDGTQ